MIGLRDVSVLRNRWFVAMLAPGLLGAAPPHLKSSPEMGKAEGACRQDEPGPAFIIVPRGLKDRSGWLKAEVYPADDSDFLQDDKILVAERKTFRRTEIDLPANGPIELCVRVPAPGVYAISLLHDRDRNHKFNLSGDGVGFSGNPRLGWSKPKAASARILAGAGLTRVDIVLNYRRGLFSIGPIAP